MKIKIYVAGKVTGENQNDCMLKFKTAAENLEKLGFETVNPLEVVNNWETPWHIAMDMCLQALADCKAIYMLSDSVNSPGAMVELDFAIKNNLLIYYELQTVEYGNLDHVHG